MGVGGEHGEHGEPRERFSPRPHYVSKLSLLYGMGGKTFTTFTTFTLTAPERGFPSQMAQVFDPSTLAIACGYALRHSTYRHCGVRRNDLLSTTVTRRERGSLDDH
jgi:hypothetical protein